MTKENKKEHAVIAISDTHIGSTNALCPKTFPLDDGGTYMASHLQHILAEMFDDFIQKAEKLTRGHTRTVIINGDIGELDSKKRSHQVITNNKATIMRMVEKTLEPLIALADNLVVVRGTAAHTGNSSWIEEWFASNYGDLTVPQSDGIFSHFHFKRQIGGVNFDVAHHARMGGMRHTQKAYPTRLASDVMDKYRDRSETPPDVVLRSHNHRRGDSGFNWPTFVSYLPCWQGHTEFIYRIGGENDNPQIGGDVFLCHPAKGIRTDLPFQAHEKFVWYPINYDPYSYEPTNWEPI